MTPKLECRLCGKQTMVMYPIKCPFGHGMSNSRQVTYNEIRLCVGCTDALFESDKDVIEYASKRRNENWKVQKFL